MPSTFWIQFVSACIAAFLLEQAADWLVEATSRETSPVAQSIFDISGLYQQLVTTGPRQPISHYTTIIEINPEKDHLAVGYTSLCRQRAFLASLLNVVARGNPAVIVVDKYFDNSKCLVDEMERSYTAELESALSSLVLRVPIVSGIDASPSKRPSRDSNSPAAPVGDALPFLPAIVNLDFDTRRLPLRWKLNKEEDAETLSRTHDGRSLALEAAAQYDPRILTKNQRLKEMSDIPENPYISFLKQDQFTQFYAGEILCLVPNKMTPGSACDQVLHHDPKAPPRLRDLSHQIVVIGERAVHEDIHNSAIGEVPGFYLHANYIEALLDDRLFRPVHPLINYVIGFFIFAGFEYILIRNLTKPFWAILKILCLLAVTSLFLYLAVVHLGYYLNPATVGLLAIFINLGHLAIARAEEHQEPEKELHHQQGS